MKKSIWIGLLWVVGCFALETNAVELTVISGSGDVEVFATQDNDHDHPPGLTALGALFDNPAADAEAVVYSNGYAYVACGYAGVIVFDVNNPANPERVGGYDTEGFAKAVALQSNHLFVADDEFGLVVLDVTVPSAPVLAGQVENGRNYNDIAVFGDYAYLAASSRGLHVFDIRTNSNLQLVGECDTYQAYGVSVVGDYAYVADSTEGLKIINVSTPSAPFLAGSYDNLYRSYDVAVLGDFAYVADNTNGLQIINVSDPASPTYAGEYATEYSYGVAVEGSYAYLANSGYGFEVVSIGNPSAPVSVDAVRYNGSARDLFVADGKAYVASGSEGLFVFDVSAPSNISEMGSYNTHRYSYDVAVNGSYAYLAAYRDGIITVDISDPNMPVILATNKNASYAYRLDIVDDMLYVAANYDGLVLYDLANPANPSFVTEYDFVTSGGIRDVKVSGNYAYCANSSSSSTNSLGIVNVSNPSDPIYVGGYNTGDSAYGVDVIGTTVYLASDSNGMQIFDATDPANPELKGAYARESSPYAGRVSVDGDYAYVLNNSDVLQIVDIQNPATPTLRQTLDLGYLWANRSDIVAAYPYVYIAWADGNYPENNGLWVVDVRDMDNLIVTNVPTSGFARGVAVSGGYVYLADDPKGLHIFTHGDPVPAGVVIDGESWVKPNSTHFYTCGVQYTDGSVSNVVGGVAWSLLGDAHGTSLIGNELSIPTVVSEETITIQAVYEEFTNTLDVTFNIPTNLFITGSSVLGEKLSNSYQCTLMYADGSFEKTTELITWSLIGDTHGATLNGNEISVGTMTSSETVVLQAVVGNLTNTFSVLLKVIPPGLTSLGTLFDDPTADAEAVVYSNGYAYVACGYAGVIVFDVNDPANPERVGGYDTEGSVKAVALQSNHLFAADNEFGLVVLDVTVPSAPVLAGQVKNGRNYNDIAVSGDYAYLAASSRGLHVFDIRTNSNLQLVGECDTYQAYGVSVVGDYAYVADSTEGLKIVDISTPTAPVLAGSYNNLSRSYDVAVQGDYAYVADDTNGLQIINISVPTNLTHVGGYATGYYRGVCVEGTYAYLANSGYGFEVVNIGNPSAPVSVDAVRYNGYARDLFVADGKAYVASGSEGLFVFDVSAPSNISEMGSYNTHRYSYDVAVNGSYAYLAAYRDGIITVDISDPNMPVILATNKNASYAYRLDIVDDMLYVAANYDGLVLYDLANPANPSFVTEYDFVTSGGIRDVKVSGNYAYCANSSSSSTNSLGIVNVSNPSDPIYVGGYNTGDSAYGVDVIGTTVYLASDSNGMQIFDATDPANPELKGAYARESSPYAGRVSVDGDYAYVLDANDGLQIIAVQNSENPTLCQTYDFGVIWAWDSDIVADYPYVYIANAGWTNPENNGLWVVDVRDMDNLIVTNGPTSGFSRGVAVSGGHVYLADEPKGLHVFTHGDPVPTGVVIDGESWVKANSTHLYTCGVQYTDGLVSNVTALATWSLLGDAHGTTLDGNELTIPAVVSEGSITIQAVFSGFTNTFEVGFVLPTNLLISGSSILIEDSTNSYRCTVQYPDGSISKATDFATWSLIGDTHGATLNGNEISVGTMDSSETIDLQAVYGNLTNTFSVLLKVIPPGLTSLGTLFDDPTAEAEAVVYSNGYAYVACGLAGVIVFDVTDPANPERVGGYDTEGSAKAVALQSNHLFVADNKFGLVVLDITTPSTPELVGEFKKSADYRDIAVSGGYAYLAASKKGLQVFDIRTLSAPQFVGSITTRSAIGVVVVGDYAYVADYSDGLKVIDISSPSTPSLAGAYNNLYRSYDVAVQGDFAYVADDTNGLQIINISVPTNLTHMGGYTTKKSQGIVVDGSYAYLANRENGVEVVDVSNPSTPISANTVSCSGSAKGVFVADGKAYVACGVAGLFVLDVSAAPSISELGSYDTHRYSYDVAVNGSYAYLAANQDGIITVDISDPNAPVIVATNTNMRGAYRLDIEDDMLYVAAESEGIFIYDLINPAKPSLVTKYDFVTSGYIRDVKVSGNYAYCANRSSSSTNSLGIVNVSDPAHPVYVGGYDTGESAYGIDVKGTTVYLASRSKGMQVFDASDPTKPELMGAYARASKARAGRVSVDGNYAYVLDDNDVLQIVDIQASGNPVLRQILDFGTITAEQSDVFVVYPYVYIAWAGGPSLENNGLWVVDVRDMDNLIVTNVPTSGYARGVAVRDGHVYLADDSKGLYVFSHAEHAPIGIAMSGASLVSADSTNIYSCEVSYSDGSTSNATASASWSLVGDAHGTSLSGNELTVPSVISDEMITIQAVSDGFTNTLEVGFNVPTNLLVSGPSLISADSVNLYACEIQYTDGSVLDGTDLADWSLLGDAHGATIDGNELTAPAVVSDETITIQVVCSGLSNTVEVGFSAPTNLVIFGDSVVNANSTNVYTCGAQFDDGSMSTVTASTVWSLLGDAHGTTLDGNNLAVPSVVFDETIVIQAVYGGVSNTFEVGFNTPTNLLITGSSVLVSHSSHSYDCLLQYADGSTSQAAGSETWRFAGNAHGAMLNGNALSVGAIASNQTVTIQADYGSLANTHSVLLKYIQPGLVHLGTLHDNPSGIIKGLYYTNGYAYAACGYAGIIIFDVSDPVTPTQVGWCDTDGEAWRCTKRGNHLFVADSRFGMTILDVSDPTRPALAGKWQDPSSEMGVYEVVVSGDYAYLAATDRGMLVIDISDISNPTLVAEYDDCRAQGMTVDGNYAYVVDSYDLLQIVDITTPTNPIAAGDCFVGAGHMLRVKDGYAYVASGNDGLHIVDVSDPMNPVPVSQYEKNGCWGMLMSGSSVYLPGGTIVDVSDPYTPKLATEDGAKQYAFVDNGVAYTGGSNLILQDVSDLSSITELGSSESLYRQALDVEVEGSYAYVAANNDGLLTVDISDPENLRAVHTNKWTSTPRAEALDISGEHAYVANQGGGLCVFDLSTPSAPVFVEKCDLGREKLVDVKVSGDYAFCANSYYSESRNSVNALCIIDISIPAAPVFAGGYNTGGVAYGVDIQGSYAYLAAEENGLMIFDISDPTAPELTGSYARDIEPSAGKVSVSGNYAYVLDNKDVLQIINISNPYSPTCLSVLDMGDAGYRYADILIEYPYVFLAFNNWGSDQNGLFVIDVSDPLNPVAVANHFTSGTGKGVAIANGNVYLADPPKTLHSFSWGAISTPTKTLFGINMIGSDSISIGETNIYTCQLEYSDRSFSDGTTSAVWNIIGNAHNTGLSENVLTASAITSNAVITLQSTCHGFTNSVTVDVFFDKDINGIPDSWERRYYGGATRANPSATCSNGINTVREAYIAGLDPTDPGSKFLTSILPGNALRWNAISGRVYSIWWTTNLLENFQPLEPNLPWTQGGYTNPNPGQTDYYKIKIKMDGAGL